MSDKVAPIPLPERGQDLDGAAAITGWGWGVHLTLATSLKYLLVSVVSPCQGAFEGGSKPIVDDNMFCSRPGAFGANVCYCDSGSALAMRDPESGDVYAAGILSYDKACTNNEYAVYMKLSSYLPWIHSVIRGDTEKSSALRIAAMNKMLAWQQ